MRTAFLRRIRLIAPLVGAFVLFGLARPAFTDPPLPDADAAPAEAPSPAGFDSDREPEQPQVRQDEAARPESATPSPKGQSPAALPWNLLAPGLWQTSLAHSGTDSFRLKVFRVSLDHFDIQAADARRMGENVKYVTAEEAARHSGAVLAVNGSFFDEHNRPLGMVISRGERINSFRQADWGVLYVRDRQARLIHTRDWAGEPVADAWFAIQVGPRLVVDGKPTHLKPQVARRAAIGIRPGGRELVVLVTDQGRASAGDLAAIMARPEAEGGLGCVDAVAMDGGPSSQLHFSLKGHHLSVRGAWPVPMHVVFLPHPPPSGTP